MHEDEGSEQLHRGSVATIRMEGASPPCGMVLITPCLSQIQRGQGELDERTLFSKAIYVPS